MVSPSALVRVVPRLASGMRPMSVIAAPPKFKMSFFKKCLHGVVMSVGIMLVPTIVLVNLKNFHPHEETAVPAMPQHAQKKQMPQVYVPAPMLDRAA